MATQFTISSINYANTAVSGQIWTFQYKLFSDPDTSYILISSSAAVAADGNLAVPLTVTGLTSGQLYYLLATNNCGSPAPRFVQQIQL